MEPELGLTRSESETKGTMCVETMLKNRKTVRYTLYTGAEEVAHDLKEEDIVDRCEPEVCLTLSEERKTAMSKVVQAKASLYFMYVVNFRNVAEEEEISVGKYLSSKLDFVLTDPPYNV